MQSMEKSDENDLKQFYRGSKGGGGAWNSEDKSIFINLECDEQIQPVKMPISMLEYPTNKLLD